MQDFLINDDGAMLVANGDLAIGYSNQQHQRHLLLFEKGSLKENITVGVGAFRYLESELQAEFLREVATQFAGDGLVVTKMEIAENGKFEIEADYK